MKIKFLQNVQTAGGNYRPGAVVDFAEENAKPLVECGAAELVKEPVSKAEKPAPVKKRGKK